ncbi:hypothetical protein [Occallatibacter riparius]|uniref:Uncharacterized protein n=1 Tax=Occallatibacter riparius TaxID=1002689 RepID=A0A9J7BPH4_9BACT|nr:hypothetical protein [Occallatibacter riparius]UWZ84433.1 hypothetical protein MOP44_00520 [Occallatibacter riparius]
MKPIKSLNNKLRYFLMTALVLMSILPSSAPAQTSHAHMGTEETELTPEQKTARSALVKIVRESTERFKDVAQAQAEGYSLVFGCVSGDSAGAMGMHYLNGNLLNGALDPTRPQIVIYEPTKDGKLKLIGADFLVFADEWNKDPKHTGPPELMGQLFHLFDAPNRFGLPAFYTLHVWAWKDNPNGAFVNWHPNVSCEQFSGQTP